MQITIPFVDEALGYSVIYETYRGDLVSLAGLYFTRHSRPVFTKHSRPMFTRHSRPKLPE